MSLTHRVCSCHGGNAAVELNDSGCGGGCGHDMKLEHGSSKRQKEPKERWKREMKKENEGKIAIEEGEM